MVFGDIIGAQQRRSRMENRRGSSGFSAGGSVPTRRCVHEGRRHDRVASLVCIFASWWSGVIRPLGRARQGVVPAKTERMASRLVDIITTRLLSLREAFGRLDPSHMAELLAPAVQEAVRRDCGEGWAAALRPVLPWVLTRLVRNLQTEIDGVLDLKSVVMSAFVRDKEVLVDLFQKARWWQRAESCHRHHGRPASRRTMCQQPTGAAGWSRVRRGQAFPARSAGGAT